jgi:hypothetical protein
MKIRHFLLLLVVLMSLYCAGCTAPEHLTDYLQTGGYGEVRGKTKDLEFSAVVGISANGEDLCVEYRSPASLEGLVLRARGEVCEVRFGALSFVCQRDEVNGFLQPVCAFLPQEDAKSVQNEGENTVYTFPAGGVLTISETGEPLSFWSDEVFLEVVWWERGNE